MQASKELDETAGDSCVGIWFIISISGMWRGMCLAALLLGAFRVQSAGGGSAAILGYMPEYQLSNGYNYSEAFRAGPSEETGRHVHVHVTLHPSA